MTIAATEGQHGARAHSDGGWDAPGGPVVPVQSRAERFRSNDPAEYPDVTGREADWKLTPLDVVRPLLDGALDGSPYAYLATTTGDGARAEWVERTDELIGSVGAAEDKAAANAWNSFENALKVTVSGDDGAHITITRSDLGSSPRSAHTLVVAEPHSEGLVILQNSGAARLVENVEIAVGEGARLTVVSVQEWDDDAVHLASHFASVGRNAFLKHIVISLGGRVVRVNPSTTLAGEGSDTESYGLYFADAGQHIEQRVYMHHEAANTRGRVNYKGALQGAGAHTVWVGDVLIGRLAAGTDSYEQNRNLVLTEGTRADSVPNLEIETGDILGAGHASATGRFDDEQLFYLQARGISEEQARRLVVLGFLSEIVQKIGSAALEERLGEAIEREIAQVPVS
jgi:Fe-S cluster assembly protein SufD